MRERRYPPEVTGPAVAAVIWIDEICEEEARSGKKAVAGYIGTYSEYNIKGILRESTDSGTRIFHQDQQGLDDMMHLIINALNSENRFTKCVVTAVPVQEDPNGVIHFAVRIDLEWEQ